MNEITEKSKNTSKDWDRHARVILLLQRNRKTVTEMAFSIGEHASNVSACIWGVPSRKNKRIEEKIAYFLGSDREILFKEEGINES
jgi:hypothetical protein